MKLPLALPADVSIALRRMANQEGLSLEQAAEIALRDWLIGNGHLELEPELDEDTETEGSL